MLCKQVNYFPSKIKLSEVIQQEILSDIRLTSDMIIMAIRNKKQEINCVDGKIPLNRILNCFVLIILYEYDLNERLLINSLKQK